MEHPMRTTLRLAVLALALAAPAVRAETKIGYVDLQRAIREVDEGKAATAVLKRDFDEKQRQLDAKRTDFEKAKADFDKQSSLMNEQARRDRGGELERKAMELQQLFVQLQKDLSGREQEAMRGIIDKMTGLVREMAEADGFTMVLERGDAGIIYAQQSLDLTNELVRKYNARHPGGGASAAKKAAAAPAGKKK
jgi:outer membrane protein